MAKNLSKFVFKQLVYDYLVGDLKGEELEKFEAKLKAEGDCYDYVELTKKARLYTESISTLTINSEVLAEVSNYKEDNLFYLFNPFDFKIPNFIKISAQLLVAASVLLFIAYLLPIKEGINWFKQGPSLTAVAPDLKFDDGNFKVTNNEVRDVKIENKIPEAINVLQKPVKKTTKEAVAKEVIVKAKPVVERKVIKTANQNEVTIGNEQLLENSSLEYVSKIQNFDQVEIKKEQEPVAVEDQIVEFIKPIKKEKKKSGPQGFLYRAYMSTNNLDVMAPKIIAIIQRVGGQKAGEKELGYLKPKGRSFHFKLPLNYREEVFEELRAFGRVKVDRENHWTKMPEGQSRVILWVEDLDLKALRQKDR